MLKDFFKHYVYPIATLSGSIIGVGFLSLPYITLRVGIWLMLFYFIVLTVLAVFLHVIFGEISLHTPDFKRFPGFVGFYLGKWPKNISLVLMILGSFGVMLAYVIIGGQFLTDIVNPLLGGGKLLYVCLYLAAASTIIFFGVETISKVEFWAMAFLLLSLLIILVKGFSQIQLSNVFIGHTGLGIKDLLLPYGAILFSLSGIGLIPEIEEMLKGNKRLLRKIIIISILIPAAIYLFFIFLILGISGAKTTESGLTGLALFLGPGLVSIALLVGIITTFSGFITQGLLLKKIFVYDMGMGEFLAWLFTCITPLLLWLLGIDAFIPLISFVGGVVLGMDGIFILLMYRKIGGRKMIIYPLTLIFILGVVYEMLYFSH